jgi:hypothetical protein
MTLVIVLYILIRETIPLLHIEEFSRILFLQSTVCTVFFLV